MDRGYTFLEVVVALAVLAVAVSVVGVAFRWMEPVTGGPSPATELVAVRRRAAETAQPHTVLLTVGGVPVFATALPDGSLVVGADSIAERFSGRLTGADRP